MIEVTCSYASAVPASLAKEQLTKLTLGDNSSLMCVAEWLAEGIAVDGLVAIATHQRYVLGWAYEGDGELHVFVAPWWRRRGIGRKLVKEFQNFGRVDACYHDDTSRAFWRACGVPARFFPRDEWLIWCELAPEDELAGIEAR
jgi:GNAT superfamily N-acetyltransferase